jgi:hypothetical protein
MARGDQYSNCREHRQQPEQQQQQQQHNGVYVVQSLNNVQFISI